MERLNVNPTRMMLTTLKRRLVTARRGHKLMKDKRDQLMKGFLELARENKRLREEVEQELSRVYESFSVASAVMSQEVMEEALMFPKQGVDLSVTGKNVMSVDVPQFSFETTAEDSSDIYPYGFASTSGELDAAIAGLARALPAMLAAELEKTRRRVNALEYVKIPQLEMTIKYIMMKLDENERGNQTRLMKVKDMILKEAIKEKREQDKACGMKI
jgi:V/A-type H+-transporting ATPase subunit D